MKTATYKTYINIAIVLICAGLSACSDVESEFAEYESRLQSTLNTHNLQVEYKPLPRPPQVRELLVTIEPQRISLLAGLQLGHCHIGQLIAETNSSLGKVRDSAAQLQYELEFLAALPSCLQHEATTSEQKLLLEEIKQFKLETLNLHIHNFVTTDDVMRGIVSPGRSSLPIPLSSDFQAEIEALTAIADSLNHATESPQNLSFDPDKWQQSMRILGQSTQVSALWRTLARAQDWLAQVNPQIAEFDEVIRCEQKGIREEALVLQNIMTLYFLQTLQPEISQWLEAARQFEIPLRALAELTQGQEWASFLNQLIGPESVSSELRRQTRVHAEQWQLFFAACRLDRPQIYAE